MRLNFPSGRPAGPAPAGRSAGLRKDAHRVSRDRRLLRDPEDFRRIGVLPTGNEGRRAGADGQDRGPGRSTPTARSQSKWGGSLAPL